MYAIPFNRDASVVHGAVETLSPQVRRVVAPNASPFTFTGTNTFIVGHGKVAVIDPGPAREPHLKALVEALSGETVTHILVTHTHIDHSPLARPLQAQTGGIVAGAAQTGSSSPLSDVALEEDNDKGFVPDLTLQDGATVSGPGWTLEAITTPGHTANHICYALREENTVFTGDHVMGWATSVIIPPDGDMDAYLASLDKILNRHFSVLRSAHGGPITDADTFLTAYRDHRLMRETQILDALAKGPSTVPQIVALLYQDVDKRLHIAAGLSVFAHLIRLARRGKVAAEGPVALNARFHLVK